MKCRNDRLWLVRPAIAIIALATFAMITNQTLAQQDDPRTEQRGERGARGGQDRGARGGQDNGDRGGRGMRGMRGGFGGMNGMGGMGGMARGGRGGFNQTTQPYFLRRDMRLFIDLLELDDDQTSIVESLLLDYETTFAESAEAMQDRYGELFPQREEDAERTEKRRVLGESMRDIGRELRDLRRATGQDRGRGGRNQDRGPGQGQGRQQGQDQAQEQAPGQTEPAAEPDANQQRLQELTEKFTAIREQMIELRPQMPQGEELDRLRAEINRLRNQWKSESDALVMAFLTNLRSVLNEEQGALWPSFERSLRREKTLTRGRLSGESVNLFVLMRDLRMSDDDMRQLDDLLDEYSIVFDVALIARNNHLDVARDEMIDAMRNGDLETAIEVSAREAELRVRVRDITKQYAETIALTLGEIWGEERMTNFLSAYHEQGFARIFRPTVMQRSFAIATTFDDLDEEALDAVQSLEKSYTLELAFHNEALTRITREEEPKQNTQRLEQRAAREEGEPRDRDSERAAREQQPLNVAFSERNELDKRYRSLLESLLTPEQVELLPPMREERQRGGRGGNAGGPGQRGGNMTDEERAARRAEFMAEFDTDGDGELNEEERAALRERFRGRGGRGGGPGGRGGGQGGPGRGNRDPGEPIT